MHPNTHPQTDDPHRTTPQRSLSHHRHRRRHRHTHTLVCVCVCVVVAAAASSSRREPNTLFLAYAQPTKLTPRETTRDWIITRPHCPCLARTYSRSLSSRGP